MLELRKVTDEDVGILYVFQADAEASAMAAFPSRDESAHTAHWTKILADETVIARSIVSNEEVVGSVVTWPQDDRRLVGYWIGKEHWGQGFASAGLGLYLQEVEDRPLYAYVAEHNARSVRVLQKNGFEMIEAGIPGPDGVVDVLMKLER